MGNDKENNNLGENEGAVNRRREKIDRYRPPLCEFPQFRQGNPEIRVIQKMRHKKGVMTRRKHGVIAVTLSIILIVSTQTKNIKFQTSGDDIIVP